MCPNFPENILQTTGPMSMIWKPYESLWARDAHWLGPWTGLMGPKFFLGSDMWPLLNQPSNAQFISTIMYIVHAFSALSCGLVQVGYRNILHGTWLEITFQSEWYFECWIRQYLCNCKCIWPDVYKRYPRDQIAEYEFICSFSAMNDCLLELALLA